MLGQRVLLPLLVSALLGSVLAPVVSGQDAGAGDGAGNVVVNGSWQAPDRNTARAVGKVLGSFERDADTGRYVGRGLSFDAGQCGDAGACVLNLSAAKDAPSVARLTLSGGPSTLEVRNSTATLSSSTATALLAAREPGMVSIEAAAPTTVTLRLAEGGGVDVLGRGALALRGGEGGNPLTLVSLDGETNVRGDTVTIGLPAGGKAFLVGIIGKGFGAVPGPNATALANAGALGGFVAAARVANATHATVVDLAGAVSGLGVANGRLTATVTASKNRGNLFAFEVAPGTLRDGNVSAYAVLVDGELAPRGAKATDLWAGSRVAPTASSCPRAPTRWSSSRRRHPRSPRATARRAASPSRRAAPAPPRSGPSTARPAATSSATT